MLTAILFATFSAAPAAAPQSFRIAEVEFAVQPPAGFCPPTGPAAAAIQMVSAADEGNVTHLALLPCGDTNAAKPDYYLFKTPKTTLATTTDRATFLAELVKALALPEFNTAQGMVDNGKIEQKFGEVVGQQPDIKGAIKPLGHDDVCAYMGGVLSFATKEISYSRAVSLCLTAVGGKVIGVMRYSDGATPSNVVRHLATARAMALAIKITH